VSFIAKLEEEHCFTMVNYSFPSLAKRFTTIFSFVADESLTNGKQRISASNHHRIIITIIIIIIVKRDNK